MLLLLACASDCDRHAPQAGVESACRVPGWAGRDVLVRLPAGWTGGPLPLVLDFHGGGGRNDGADRTTCPDGDLDDPGCLSGVADAEGFAVASPNGTPKLLGTVRSWNAGGGEGEWRCVGGEGCAQGVDDVQYVNDTLDLLGALFPVDTTRVYATGISNGAAMAHRLACDDADRFAAIAAVSGTNQAEAVPGCTPARAIPILQIHGTEDPCWGWDGAAGPCLDDGESGRFVSVDASMDGWATRMGCTGQPTEVALPDLTDDGTTAARLTWPGCAAPLELIRIDGGGHTWPDGRQYLSEEKIGRVSHDVAGSQVVWDFFAATSGR